MHEPAAARAIASVPEDVVPASSTARFLGFRGRPQADQPTGFLRRCTDRDVARILLTDGPAILGGAWDELDQRWWLGPSEDLLRQAMAEGSLVTADPHLLPPRCWAV